ncbi:MAG: ATP-binding cassette domain-containing protein [Deltaproteobacteria bacterium]|nr:MAG: ATP-binding cassette domain-containing protein [Deltaproteobacteria bacterium]
MLTVEGLQVSFEKTPVLRGVSLQVGEKEAVALVGRNGAGKTTLMRAVMGLVKADSGKVTFDGKELTGLAPNERPAFRIGYMPEDRRLIPDLTVEENILLPLWALKEKEPEKKLERVYEFLPEVKELASRRALQLSGGQQKLVALARAVIVGEKLLLLDEPFEGVAPGLAARLAEILRHLKEEGISILVSESDYTHTKGLTGRTYLLERGEIIDVRENEASG